MLTSIALVFLVGLSMAEICKKIKLPRIIGMLITGIVLGPFVLNLLDPSIRGISGELRQMALVIILIKAGLSLNIKDLKKVGRPAILMSFVPAVFEIVAYVVFAPLILHTTYLEGALLGAVIGAVSPAVVVPKMVQLIEEKRGTDKQIPQLILAGSSLDDVFVIVLFYTFLSMVAGGKADYIGLLKIPVSVITGVGLGVVTGLFLSWFFETKYARRNFVRNSIKVIIVLGVSFLFLTVEELLKNYVAVSGLLAVLSMSMVLAMKCVPVVTKRLQQKFGKLWLAAELLLFVLVGAEVNINYIATTGLKAVLLVIVCLVVRSVGVMLCLIKTKLSFKERLFCVISYIPKATVQAAIGSVPLAMNLPCGEVVLSVAVISILISAPLGAICMDITSKRLLKQENIDDSVTEDKTTEKISDNASGFYDKKEDKSNENTSIDDEDLINEDSDEISEDDILTDS